jgi:hypothetical protein
MWESGAKKLTFKQLLKIAEIYKRPVALFYLKEPPKGFKALNDYRKLANTESSNISPQLNYEIRRSYYRRQVALELSEELEEYQKIFDTSIRFTDDPEIVGKDIRTLLNIESTQQIKWQDDNQAFNGWRKAIESLGILVF